MVEFGRREAYIWNADTPAAYLLACAEKDDATIGRFLYSKEKSEAPAGKLAEKIVACFENDPQDAEQRQRAPVGRESV